MPSQSNAVADDEHVTHLHYAVTGLITRKLPGQEKEYFLLQRKIKRDIGKWEFPGGSIDPTDKGTIGAFAREMNEEAGLSVRDCLSNGRLVGRMVHHSHTTPGKQWNITLVELDVTQCSQQPFIGEEDVFSDCGWFTKEQMERLPLAHVTHNWVKDIFK